MADGFISGLLKKFGEGDEEALKTLKDLKRKLNSLDTSPEKKTKVDQAICSNEEAPRVQETYKCTSCTKEFTNKSSFRVHMKDHVSQFSCSLCNYITKRRHDLRCHMTQKHNANEGRVLNCDQCIKTFVRKSALARHVKFCHENTCAEDEILNSSKAQKGGKVTVAKNTVSTDNPQTTMQLNDVDNISPEADMVVDAENTQSPLSTILTICSMKLIMCNLNKMTWKDINFQMKAV